MGKVQSSLSHPPVLCAKGQRPLCEHMDTSPVSPEHGILLLCLLPATLNNGSCDQFQPQCHCLSADTPGVQRDRFQKKSQELGIVWKRYQDYDVFMEQTKEGYIWSSNHF